MPDAENKRAKAREVIDILEDISKVLVRAMIPAIAFHAYTASLVLIWCMRT